MGELDTRREVTGNPTSWRSGEWSQASWYMTKIVRSCGEAREKSENRAVDLLDVEGLPPSGIRSNLACCVEPGRHDFRTLRFWENWLLMRAIAVLA